MRRKELRDILRKVREIEIRTNRFVDDALAGQYRSVFKGRGMDFEEVREYVAGDDVRTIDWNVTARAGRPFVKSFREERELTVLLMVDVSASGDFGSRDRMKGEVAVEICALLAFSAIKNNDKVGLVIFSDRIEKFVPPRKGRRHVLRVLRELLFHEPAGRGTDITAALEYVSHVQRKKAVTFLVSDFRDDGFEKALAVAGRRHDLIAVRLSDRREQELPALGYLELEDPETGERVVVNTANPDFRERFAARVGRRRQALDRELRRSRVDVIDIEAGEPYVKPLMRFFQDRARRQ